jgi:acetolactate synthase-1/2/3 large subunit
MKLTGAQALVRVLAGEQVAFAFGVVGGKLAPLLHAISRENGIRYVGTRHEAAGPIMAAAAYAGSGRMAVALGEMGPGGLNLASGAGVAFNNNLAVLLVTSNQHRAASYPHSGMFMDLDTLAVLKPVTKWNAVVHDPRRMPELARRAFREALSGRPGPVHLDVPQDVLAAECELADDEFDLPPRRYRVTEGPRAAPRGIAAAADLLRQARRPLIVAGGGVVAGGAEHRVCELAQSLQAPSCRRRWRWAWSAPTALLHRAWRPHRRRCRAPAFAQSDVILAVGCRFSSWMWTSVARSRAGIIG